MAGWLDREGENERSSWEIFGYFWRFEKISLEIYLEIRQDIIGDLSRSLLDITWISMERIGVLWRYWLDIRLEIIWISKEIFFWRSLGYQGDLKEILGDLYRRFV